MDAQTGISRAYSDLPTQRAKLRGLNRNTARMAGEVGTIEIGEVPMRASDAAEPLVSEHARLENGKRGACWAPRFN